MNLFINTKASMLLFNILFFSTFNVFAQTKYNNKFDLKNILIEKEVCYSFSLSEKEIIEKEFSEIFFQLDLENNILLRVSPSSSKEFKFKLNKDGKVIFESIEIEMQLTYNELNRPILKFKEHLDDCYFTIFNF